MQPTLPPQEKARAVKYYQRLRRMHTEVGAWELMRRVGESFGVGPNAIRVWALKAGQHKPRVYFTDEARRAAAECCARLSELQPERKAVEIAWEVAYAYGISPKVLRSWVSRFGLYRRPKIGECHPWRTQRRFVKDGDGGIQADGSGGVQQTCRS